jgi:hypothetical protein
MRELNFASQTSVPMAADTNATSIHENRELVRLLNTEKLPIGGEKKYDAGKIDPKKSRLNSMDEELGRFYVSRSQQASPPNCQRLLPQS